VDSATAQENCKRNGGHLAAYISLEEQAEVEQFYIKRGFLLEKFHQVYWMGLRVGGAPGRPAAPQLRLRRQGFASAGWAGLGWAASCAHTHCCAACLQVNGTWPKFGWLDPTVDPPSFRTYAHWGTNATTNLTEPQNQRPQEACGGARYHLSFDMPSAWGWADEACNNTYIFMCRITRWWRCCLTLMCRENHNHAAA
jgi:hypothetical protein